MEMSKWMEMSFLSHFILILYKGVLCNIYYLPLIERTRGHFSLSFPTLALLSLNIFLKHDLVSNDHPTLGQLEKMMDLDYKSLESQKE